MDKLQKFFPLVKVDESQRLVYGLVTAERKDKDGETCHYESTKVEYKAVNDELGKASGGENIMPLREMHQLNAVGCGKSITFDDANKQILMAFKVVDDSAWKKVLEKVLLGFSQGGRYIKKWKENGTEYYTAQPGEVSLVDNPCLPGAYIEYAKADGAVEFFKTPGNLSDEDVSRLSKSVISELSTQLEEIRALFSNSSHSNAATGEAMKPEQIKKCAEALGISEEDFSKQFIPSDTLEKAKKGLAALHGHLKKAHAAAEEHVGHIEKCMKACSDVMGDDHEKAVKALDALVEELTKAVAPNRATKDEPKPEVITKADAQKLVDDAVAKAVKEALDKLPKNDMADRTALFSVKRGENVAIKAEEANPYPGVV